MAAKALAMLLLLSLLITSDVGEGQTVCEVAGPVVFPCLNGCSQFCYTGNRCRGHRCTGFRCVRLGIFDRRSQCYCRWRC